MAKIIYGSQIEDFLAEIAETADVVVPVDKGRSHVSQYSFQKWTPGDVLELNYPVTILPPKEFILPHKEVLFSFDGQSAVEPKPEKQVIFGLSVEDLEGIEKLTEIMKKPISDEPYKNRRANTFLIGLDKYSPPAHLDFDLYLQEVESGVFAGTAKTKLGKKWLTSKSFKNHELKIPSVLHKEDSLLTDPDLPKAIKDSKDHPIWKELTETCFGCGICSYVCPLCYCTETEDKIEFGDSECGERCRNWDSCMLQNFSATTNHNFRPELSDRIYNWYFHKFYRMSKEYGFVGCVDCNRCVIYCPAKINYRRVLSRILTDYKKRPKK
jgi:sulfhydrogenase subunit beta (sulfur reductase)